MGHKKAILFILVLFIFLFFHLPVLEAQTSVHSEGQQRMLESKMYMTRRQKIEVRQQPGDLKYKVEKFTQKVKRALEGLRSKQRNNRVDRERAKAKMDAVKEQLRMQRYRQEAMLASQRDRLRNMKDRMETVARRRKELMEFQTRR